MSLHAEVWNPRWNEDGEFEADFLVPLLKGSGVVILKKPDDEGKFRVVFHVTEPGVDETVSVNRTEDEGWDAIVSQSRLDHLATTAVERAMAVNGIRKSQLM